MQYVLYVIIAVLAIGLYMLYKAYTDAKLEIENEEKIEEVKKTDKFPYSRKYLLTKNESGFYKSLKEVADKYDYGVLAKIRLADLIEVSAEAGDKKEKLKYFAKIKSKHIDFALCNKENMYVNLLIELNDSSHDKQERKERDIFVENALEKAGYKFLVVYGNGNLEEEIINALSLERKAQEF